MKQELFHPAERERRLRIIEAGIEKEFWEVLKDSMIAYCTVRSKEQIVLAAAGKRAEAERLAIEIMAIERIINEPTIIIQETKPIFDRYVMQICKACGHVAKKLKEAISRESRGESQTHGGINA